MSLEKVSDEIVLEAKKEAEKIKDEARREAERIILSAKNTIEEKRKQAEAETEGIIDAMMKKELSSAKLEEKRLVLDAKKAAIEKTYAGMDKTVAGMDRKAKEKIYSALIQKARREIEPAYICASGEDADMVKKIAEGMQVLKESMLGGLVFESADKKVRLDMSFDSALAGVKSGEIKETSKILFGEGA